MEQNEVPKLVEPDKPLTKETRRGGCKKTSMTYNRYGDDFLIDKIKPDDFRAEMVGVSGLVPDQEKQIIDNDAPSGKTITECTSERWIWNIAKKNLRILEWIYDLLVGN